MSGSVADYFDIPAFQLCFSVAYAISFILSFATLVTFVVFKSKTCARAVWGLTVKKDDSLKSS
jgi:hypothetical protein